MIMNTSSDGPGYLKAMDLILNSLILKSAALFCNIRLSFTFSWQENQIL